MTSLVPADTPLVSVVMPVYNELATIDEIVRRVMAVAIPLQLIVVDDVSTDGTWERLRTLQRELGFTLVRQDRQRGKGAAVRRGFKQVAGDLVVIQDADLEYAPEEYPRLIEPIVRDGADVVYGSRFRGNYGNFMLANYVANRLFTFLTNVLYGTSLTDMATCYKMMRTDVMRSLALRSNKFDLDFEITAKVLRTRRRISEVPISYRGRSYREGKKITWRDGITGAWMLLKHRITVDYRGMADVTNLTAERFGHGWSLATPAPLRAPVAYHFHKMRTVLDAPPFTGLVLDAGCGEGIDLASVVLSDACHAVGVELSDGGVRTTRAQIAGSPGAKVVQASLLALPFAGEVFDGAYSYGVVHHTTDPAVAMREIVRTLKPGASVLIYIYEDFSDRPPAWRMALAIVNTFRELIWRLPPRAIHRVCRAMAPIVYVCCTYPSKHFRWAAGSPYPHSQHASIRSLVPDLYDLFAAPIEQRYSKSGAVALAEQAGLIVRRFARAGGWMMLAEKPHASHLNARAMKTN